MQHRGMATVGPGSALPRTHRPGRTLMPMLVALGMIVASAICVLVLHAGAAAASITLVPVLSGLDNPVLVANARDGSHRLFIVEQAGVIKVLQAGAASPTVVLDISAKVQFGGEQGLLGLTFHPQFASNGRFFVNYTREPDGATVVAQYQMSTGNPNVADPSETTLLVMPQPFANHNGGMIEFGPDGFLYIATGDGGSGDDPGNRAQDNSQLLGKILRIDVDHPSGGLPYSSPPDNPFVGDPAGRAEIFAYGLRNPYRFSFDRATGDLYAGDVGQNAMEEIDIITRGGNYGWRTWEGTQCTGNDPTRCNAAGYIFPITEYAHAAGRCAVIGGYVYRGARATLPGGSYIYGDLCSGEVFLLQLGFATIAHHTGRSLSSFGEDEAGELYVVSIGGTVERIANACDAGGASDPACPPVGLLASVNEPQFSVGRRLVVTVGFTNQGFPAVADFYVGIVQPDGVVAFFTSTAETIAFGDVADPASYAPIATQVPLDMASSTTVPGFFSHEWTGAEQRGAYTLFILVLQAGALQDGTVTSGEILGLATTLFSFP
jgi:glucose/arabinose dehydrogenase